MYSLEEFDETEPELEMLEWARLVGSLFLTLLLGF